MSLIELLLVIVVGVIMWLINTYIPMARAIKAILNAIVFILLLIFVLQFFGLINTIIPFPKL